MVRYNLKVLAAKFGLCSNRSQNLDVARLLMRMGKVLQLLAWGNMHWLYECF